MGVSGSPQIRQKRGSSKNNRDGRLVPEMGAGPSSVNFDVDGKGTSSNLPGDVEVKVANKNMNVSTDAWKAFQVYQKYDDWSSETEKTDYTYSRLSSFRHKEVIPGFPVRPNLCRSPIKPSTPNSLHNYSFELEQQRNRSSARKNHVARNIITEDTTDIYESEEQISLYRRFVQSLVTFWALLTAASSSSVESLRNGVVKSSSLFAGSIVSIWTLTTAATFYVGSTILRGWSKIFGRGDNVQVAASDSEVSAWWSLSENFIVIWIKTSIHTVVTTITTFYSKAAENQNNVSRRRYLWLLLLPLLLLAGWWLLSDEGRQENVVALISSAGPALASFGKSSTLYFGALYEALEQLISLSWKSLWDGFTKFIPQSTSFISASANGVINALSELLWICGDFIQTWNRYFVAGIYDGGVFVGNIFAGSFANIAHSFWLFYNHSKESLSTEQFWDLDVNSGDGDANIEWDLKSTLRPELDEELESSGHGAESNFDSSYIVGIQKRIATLEALLDSEKTRRYEEDVKLQAVLKNYHQILQSHRLNADAAVRRCCRSPCPSAPVAPVTVPAVAEPSAPDVDLIMADLRQQSAAEIDSLRAELSAILARKEESASAWNDGSIDVGTIRQIVNEAIKIYDADKTGRADYALESAGGRVVSIRCSKTYTSKGFPSWSLSLFWPPTSSPDDAIRPGTAPGECWAFQGPFGYLALELSYPVKVTGFTMEHIAKELSPSGTIDSAPQHFSMWGLKHADDLYEQYLFGEYVYEDSGQTIQYFPVKNPSSTFYKFVELKIISNHGHPDYTCLYRIRVHGTVT